MTVVLTGAGCAQPGHVPVAERSAASATASGSYRVRSGDTLYSIAWRFGFDHRALARANGIRPPYLIYPGQSIRLAAESSTARGSGAGAAAPPVAEKPSRSTAHARPRAAQQSWRLPTDAPVARSYGSGNKGIDYRLAPGQRVQAAAAGEVVYAGSGLGGFRYLVIVKHSPSFLSAYSLDGPMTVREGQRVKAGEVVADMKDGGRRNGKLHFEIRRDGEPVDPASLIGKR